MSTEKPESKNEKVVESSQVYPVNSSGWLEKIEKLTKIAERFIWLFILVIITTSVANLIKMQSLPPGNVQPVTERLLPIERPISVQVDQDLASALRDARLVTKDFASAQLEDWEAEVMKRVDDSFLPWYFDYWNQQILGLNYLFQGSYHWFNSKSLSPEDAQVKLIQKELENRALSPEINRSTLSQIIEDSVNLYTGELSARIDQIPKRYKIPQANWEEYLADLSLMTERFEANREISLAEKSSVAAGVGGAYTIAKVLKFGGAQALETQLAAKGAAKGAAKSGTKVIAKLGVEAVGSILGVGIIVWDIWDHYHTKAVQLPILRENIQEYLERVKIALLRDPKYGLISVIYDLEAQVLKASSVSQKA